MESELHQHGIWAGPATDVLPAALVHELTEHVATLQSPGPSERKPYLAQWLGQYPVHDPASIWARIADVLHPVAESYLAASARLYYYNLWQSLPTDAPPRDSQLWHQDIEDTRLLKAFLYLTDVTAAAGPLSYIPGTHWRGSRRISPNVILQKLPKGPYVSRTTDAAMARCVPSDEWRTVTVPQGTLVLADTTGWHKGGHAKTVERRCAVWEWVTPSCKYGPRFR